MYTPAPSSSTSAGHTPQSPTGSDAADSGPVSKSKKVKRILSKVARVIKSFDIFHYKVPSSLQNAVTNGRPDLLPIKEVYSWWGFVLTLILCGVLVWWIYAFGADFFAQYPYSKTSNIRAVAGTYPVPTFGISVRPRLADGSFGPPMSDSRYFHFQQMQVSTGDSGQTYSMNSAFRVSSCNQVPSIFMGWAVNNSFCTNSLIVDGTSALSSERYFILQMILCTDPAKGCVDPSKLVNTLSDALVTVSFRQHSFPDEKTYRFDYRLSPSQFALDATMYFSVFRTESKGFSVLLDQNKPARNYVQFSREHSFPSYHLLKTQNISFAVSVRQDFTKTFQSVTYEGWSTLFSRIGGVIFFTLLVVGTASLAYNKYLFSQENPDFGQRLQVLLWNRANTTVEEVSTNAETILRQPSSSAIGHAAGAGKGARIRKAVEELRQPLLADSADENVPYGTDHA